MRFSIDDLWANIDFTRENQLCIVQEKQPGRYTDIEGWCLQKRPFEGTMFCGRHYEQFKKELLKEHQELLEDEWSEYRKEIRTSDQVLSFEEYIQTREEPKKVSQLVNEQIYRDWQRNS